MKKLWTPGPERLEDGLLEARSQSESGARRQRKWRGGPEPSKNIQPSSPGPLPFLCTSEDSFAFVLIFFCTPWLTPTERCPCPSSFPSSARTMQVTVMRVLFLGLLLPIAQCQWWGGGFRRPSSPFRHSHRSVSVCVSCYFRFSISPIFPFSLSRHTQAMWHRNQNQSLNHCRGSPGFEK